MDSQETQIVKMILKKNSLLLFQNILPSNSNQDTTGKWKKKQISENRTANPETNPHLQGQLIFLKRCQDKQKKNHLFNKWHCDNWEKIGERTKLDRYLTSYTNTNTKQIKKKKTKQREELKL